MGILSLFGIARNGRLLTTQAGWISFFYNLCFKHLPSPINRVIKWVFNNSVRRTVQQQFDQPSSSQVQFPSRLHQTTIYMHSTSFSSRPGPQWQIRSVAVPWRNQSHIGNVSPSRLSLLCNHRQRYLTWLKTGGCRRGSFPTFPHL